MNLNARSPDKPKRADTKRWFQLNDYLSLGRALTDSMAGMPVIYSFDMTVVLNQEYSLID